MAVAALAVLSLAVSTAPAIGELLLKELLAITVCMHGMLLLHDLLLWSACASKVLTASHGTALTQGSVLLV